MSRQPWSAEHERHVFWGEKIFAGGLLLLGAFMAYWGDGVGSYVGVGLASVGAYQTFPKLRPVISGLVDRIPFLAEKEPPKPPDA